MSILNKGAGDGTAPVTLESIMAEVNKNLDARFSAKFDDFKKTGLTDAIKAHVDPVMAQLTTVNEALGKLVAGTGGGGGTPPPDAGKGQVPPEINVRLQQLTERVGKQDLTISALETAKATAEKRAEETDRHSVIRTALNSVGSDGLAFVNEKAQETAFSIILPHIRRLEDGGLVAELAGDNFPVTDFTKDYLKKEHNYLFKSTGTSGSGAPVNPGSPRLITKADTNSIKIGMKPEERQAVLDSIGAAMASSAA